MWQMGMLECFHLSFQAIPTLSGAHYQNDYNVIQDYAKDRGFDALELLSVCQRIAESYKKK